MDNELDELNTDTARPEGETVLPSPALVVLIGASGSGKSTWAAENFRPGQVLATDDFRALVGNGPDDQSAGTEAFALLDQLVATRLAKGLTTVVDTVGLDADLRARWRAMATDAGVPCVAVAFATAAKICRARNAARPRPVPKAVIDRQLRAWRRLDTGLDAEGFDLVVRDPAPARQVPPSMLVGSVLVGTPVEASESDAGATAQQATPSTPTLGFDLVISAFDFDDVAGTLAAMAKAAEAVGFRSLWLMDHFRQVPQVGRAWDPMLEPYTTLANLAAHTAHLRLGTLVTNVEHRNIGLLAKIIATLDVVSGGRAECGLGAGWFSAEQAAYGYPVNSNRIRLDTLEDALQALPILWGPGAKSFEGKVLSVPEAMGYPRPIQSSIPLLVGGGGEQRTLRLVARHADACNVMGSNPEVVAKKIEILRRHCVDIGRDPDDVTVTTLNPIVHAGNGRQLADAIEALRPSNRSAESVATAVNAGTTDEHVARFGQLADLGVDRCCVAFTGLAGPDGVEAFGEVIEAFA